MTMEAGLGVRMPRTGLGSAGRRDRWRPRKRIVQLMIFLLSLAGFAGAVRTVLAPGRFPVRVVRVVGDLTRIPRTDLVSALEPFLRQNFYGLRLDAVGQAVAAVPWVGHVHVERRFPRTLVIYVDPVHPVARWAAGGWVSRQGLHVHLQGLGPHRSLPLFQGPPGGEQDMLNHFQRFQAILQPLGFTIAGLKLSTRESWRIIVQGGPQLVLGRQGSARLTRFAQVFGQLAAKRAAMRTIDLRYTNGFAISWRKAHGDQHDQKG